MHCLTFRPVPFLWLLFFAISALLLSGCQQKNLSAGAPDQEVMGSTQGSEEPDFSCSYFYFLWGRQAELLHHFEEALEAYEKVLICDPSAQHVSRKIPVLLLRLDRTDEAETWLDNYLTAHPEETGVRMLYAKVLSRQNKPALAMRQYQLLSDLHPDDPTVLLVLAEMYLSSKQTDKARKSLERLLKLDSGSYTGHILMARLCQQEKEIDKAIDHYRKALDRNWSSELQMELGELFVNAERYDDAVALYTSIIEREEDNESARIALVHVYLIQKKENLALAELNSLRSFVDQPQRIDFTIARLYARQKQYERAITIIKKLLLKEDLSEARYFLALLYFQTEQYERALAQLQQVDRKAPEFMDALFLQVRILREQGRLDQGILRLEKSLAEPTGRKAEMYIMLAALYQLQSRDDMVKKVLLQGLEIYPENENLLYEYGLQLETGGDHHAALEVMQKIIQLQPNNAAALNFVGYSWADKQVNLDKALDYIQRAIELKPDNGYIRDSLGWVYYRLGRLDKALVELEMANKLSPDDPAILDHLGDVYLESGRVKDALQAYEKAAALFVDDEKAREMVREKIQAVRKQVNP